MAMLERILTPNAFLVAIFAVVLSKLWGGNTKSVYDNKMRYKSAVLVTGVSRGIGQMIARNLVFWGYTVYGSVRSQEKYDELVEQQKVVDSNRKVERTKWLNDPHRNPNQPEPGRIIPVLFDVTDDNAIEDAVKAVQESCKKHDVKLIAIVNNAGINPEGDMIGKSYKETGKAPDNVLTDPKTVLEVLNVNFVGMVRVTKAFLPLVDKQSGRIVLVGSYFGTIAGALGLAHCAYEASKFAVEALADNLRRGLKGDDELNQIQVSLIKPGNIITDMNKLAGESPSTDVSKEVLFAIESRSADARYYPGMVKGLPCKWVCDFFTHLPSVFTDTQL
mmetsp:Transcript_48159/g.116892  ORF Transcript_48159/g.116892 Transcript_48159/m.116892 type:complete len:333 (+) Transcript_48159:227-1225(+)